MRDASRRIASLFWLPWLLLGWLAFSFSRLGSPHYLELFSVPVSVMAGRTLALVVGFSAWRRYLSVTALIGSAVWVLVDYRHFSGAGIWVTMFAILCILCVAAMAIPAKKQRAPLAAVLLFLLIPFAFSLSSAVANPVEGTLPGSIFLELKRKGEGNPAYSSTENDYVAGRIDSMMPALRYMNEEEPHIKYLAAVPMFNDASIIATHFDRSAVPIYNEPLRHMENHPDDLRRLINREELRYVLVKKWYAKKSAHEMQVFLKSGVEITEKCGLPEDTPWVLFDMDETINE